MKPDDSVHNLQKKTGEEHVSGYAGATRTLVIELAEVVFGASCGVHR
jgi:hypothetical protein